MLTTDQIDRLSGLAAQQTQEDPAWVINELVPFLLVELRLTVDALNIQGDAFVTEVATIDQAGEGGSCEAVHGGTCNTLDYPEQDATPKREADQERTLRGDTVTQESRPKRGRGRPRGSKNKKRVARVQVARELGGEAVSGQRRVPKGDTPAGRLTWAQRVRALFGGDA